MGVRSLGVEAGTGMRIEATGRPWGRINGVVCVRVRKRRGEGREVGQFSEKSACVNTAVSVRLYRVRRG